MNLGVDIGTTKTVIYKYSVKGEIVEDKGGDKDIPTVIDISESQRMFGNSCEGSVRDLFTRKRYFTIDLNKRENQILTYYFLNHLSTIPKDIRSSLITIPEFFDYKHRNILHTLAQKSNIKCSGFISQLTASAAYFGYFHNEKNYIVVDFGTSRTSVGLFSFDGKIVKAIDRYVLKRGAYDFDEVITNVLIEENNLNDNSFIRQQIYNNLKDFKAVLNNLTFSQIPIINDKNYLSKTLKMTKETFLNKIDSIYQEIVEFINNSIPLLKKQVEGDVVIEVTGMNSLHFLVKRILKEINHSNKMSKETSAAFGAAMAAAFNTKANFKCKVKDILAHNIIFKVENETPITVFDKHTTYNSDKISIKYEKTEPFTIKVYEDDMEIGSIDVNGENPSVECFINYYGLLEVTNFDFNSNFIIENIEEFEETDKRYNEIQQQKSMVEQMRNTLLEASFCLSDNLKEIIELSEDDEKIIQEMHNFIGDLKESITVEEESAVKNSVLEQLKPINDRIKNILETTKLKGKKLSDEIEEYLGDNEKVKTFSKTSISNLKVRLDLLITTLNFDCLDVTKEMLKSFDVFEQDFKRLKDTVIFEIEAEKRKEAEWFEKMRKEAEATRIKEEKARKAELEKNKKAEEEKAKEEPLKEEEKTKEEKVKKDKKVKSDEKAIESENKREG